jgi:hypothetical protein
MEFDWVVANYGSLNCDLRSVCEFEHAGDTHSPSRFVFLCYFDFFSFFFFSSSHEFLKTRVCSNKWSSPLRQSNYYLYSHFYDSTPCSLLSVGVCTKFRGFERHFVELGKKNVKKVKKKR